MITKPYGAVHRGSVQSSKIQSVETLIVALPTRREHKWTGLTESIGRYVLVRMTDDAGNVGWGEAPALKDWGGEFGRYFGESTAIVELVIERYLAPAAIGVPVGNIGELHRRMDAAIKGYPYAKAAIDFAAYDLAGRRARRAGAYAARRRRARLDPGDAFDRPDGDRGRRARGRAGRRRRASRRSRSRSASIRSATSRSCARIRAAVGPDVELCVDANEGYRTPGEAIKTIRKMEPFGLIYAEQPVHGIERIAEVARAIDTPVMADESAWNAHDVIQIIERRAAQIVSIYTTKPGGLYRAMEVAAVCRAAGIICNVNGSVETGVGNLANIAARRGGAGGHALLRRSRSRRRPAQRGQIGGIYYKDDLIVARDGVARRRHSAFRPARAWASTSIREDRKIPSQGLKRCARKSSTRQRKIMADNGLDAMLRARRRTSPTHRLRRALAADHALAPRDGHRQGRRQARGLRRRHGSDHDPQPRAGRRRPHLGRVHRQRDDGAGGAACRHGAGVPRVSASRWTICRRAISRRLRQTLPKATLRRGRSASRALRQIKTPDEIDAAAPALAHRRPVDHRRARGGEGRQHRDGHRRAMTRSIYTLGAEHFKLMIVATGERSQLPNVGPSERTLAAAGRLPRRDLLDDRRLPGRACAAPRSCRRRRRTPSASGRISSNAST